MQRQKVSGMNWVILLSKLVRLQLGSVLKASLLRYVTWEVGTFMQGTKIYGTRQPRTQALRSDARRAWVRGRAHGDL
jgi:hypothetical protein